MKININIGNLKTKDINVENVSLGVMFNPSEIKEVKDNVVDVIKDIPNIVNEIAKAQNAVDTYYLDLETKEKEENNKAV